MCLISASLVLIADLFRVDISLSVHRDTAVRWLLQLLDHFLLLPPCCRRKSILRVGRWAVRGSRAGASFKVAQVLKCCPSRTTTTNHLHLYLVPLSLPPCLSRALALVSVDCSDSPLSPPCRERMIRLQLFTFREISRD